MAKGQHPFGISCSKARPNREYPARNVVLRPEGKPIAQPTTTCSPQAIALDLADGSLNEPRCCCFCQSSMHPATPALQHTLQRSTQTVLLVADWTYSSAHGHHRICDHPVLCSTPDTSFEVNQPQPAGFALPPHLLTASVPLAPASAALAPTQPSNPTPEEY